jgi:RNA polymerase primary sigma factor
VDKIGKMRRAALDLSEKLGRDPTDVELAEHLDMPVAKVVELRTVGIRPASLDAPIGEDDTTEFGEIVGDDDASTPSEMLQDKALREDIRELMTKLDDRERLILTQRFGLTGSGKEQTLEQIGAKLGITRERVRQIQNIALRKLRKMMDKRDKPRKS